jgi:hypothetical protein
MTTDVGSFKSYQLTEGRTTPVSVRVSPTEKIRAEIDALFGGERELGEVIEDVARLGARLIIQTALEAEVEAFLGRARYQRSAAAEDARPGLRIPSRWRPGARSSLGQWKALHVAAWIGQTPFVWFEDDPDVPSSLTQQRGLGRHLKRGELTGGAAKWIDQCALG